MTMARRKVTNRARAGKLGGNRQSAGGTSANAGTRWRNWQWSATEKLMPPRIPTQPRPARAEPLKELEGQVKAFVDGHRAELVGQEPRAELRRGGLPAEQQTGAAQGACGGCDRAAESLGRDNLIKRTETLDREALRREPAELLCKLGAYINQTDEFYYDVSEAEAKEL